MADNHNVNIYEFDSFKVENAESNSDNLVGIYFKKEKLENGKEKLMPIISFPYGYKLPENNDNKNDRQNAVKEIFLLIQVLNRFKDKKEGDNEINTQDKDKIFPLFAYMDVLDYYFNNGYYKEREHEYKVDTKGKINWKRTIATQKVLSQNNNPIYTKFVVKKNQINENDIITEIHKYCVADGLFKIGFLFNIKYDLSQYHSNMSENTTFLTKAKMILNTKLHHTNNDKLKRLFKSMLLILEKNDYLDNEFSTSQFGTKSFNIVWEKMIDAVFGIPEKYYSKINYILFDGNKKEPNIMPDTIMKTNNYVFVIDAKYYKYGITKNKNDLPEGASVVKQIAYGEHVYNLEQKEVYNAFIMPFEGEENEKPYKNVGCVGVQWKGYDEPYKIIQLILLDTKYLMKLVNDSNYDDERIKLEDCFLKLPSYLQYQFKNV